MKNDSLPLHFDCASFYFTIRTESKASRRSMTEAEPVRDFCRRITQSGLTACFLRQAA
jgi:hypothetical protein